MILNIKVKPNSKKDQLYLKDGIITVEVKEKPVEGKANQYLIKFFKKEYKTRIKIVKGEKSQNKVIEILEFGEKLKKVLGKCVE